MEVAGKVRRNLQLLREKRFTSSRPVDEDLVLDIIWALQDIAIIRIVGANFKDPKGVAVVNEYFHLLLDHLVVEDLPQHGMKIEDVNEIKAHLENAKAYPIDSNEWDSNLAAVDGTLTRILLEER